MDLPLNHVLSTESKAKGCPQTLRVDVCMRSQNVVITNYNKQTGLTHTESKGHWCKFTLLDKKERVSKQDHEVEEGGNAGSEVGIVEEDADKEAVTKHDQRVESEVEKDDGPISEWENVAHLQEERDETHRHKEDQA